MITWSSEKDKWLRENRGISFTHILEIIEHRKYLGIVQNPAYDGQNIFIIRHNDYTYAVPFELDLHGNIILKTIYASRKYHKMYRENHES
jgi:hypothetical protein